MVAIVDYGVGNLFSLVSSLKAIGADVTVTSDEDVLKSADQIILPGVGAFEDAANKLRESGLDTVIKDEATAGKPLMGICLGMQMHRHMHKSSYRFCRSNELIGLQSPK